MRTPTPSPRSLNDALDRALDAIDTAVVVVDAAGGVQQLNRAAERITGWSDDEARGRSEAEIIHLTEEPRVLPRDEPPSLAGLFDLDDGAAVERPREAVLVRRDGQRFTVYHGTAPLEGADGGEAGRLVVLQDVTERRHLELQVAHQASHDALTGLLNRVAFARHLEKALARDDGGLQVLLYVDLDRFKLVNSTCGHSAGDDLLQWVAARLRERNDEGAVLARLGGDEFGVLSTVDGPEAGLQLAESLRETLRQFQFTWEDKAFSVTASFGVVAVGPEYDRGAELLATAEQACQVAKDKGRDRVEAHFEGDAEAGRRQQHMNWVARIKKNLHEDRVQLYAQAIQPLDPARQNEGQHFEILLRMVGDRDRMDTPGEVILAAERFGLMPMLDRWVVRQTLQTLSELPPRLLDKLHLCSINLSAVTVRETDLVEYVVEQLEEFGIPGHRICFEITETAAIESMDQALRLIYELRQHGCRFALDDFGSGMASYAYLRDLPVNLLKIDGAFVENLLLNPLDRAMVESITQIAHLLEMRTVAEAASSEPVVQELRQMGVDYAQGNWFCPPIPLTDMVFPQLEDGTGEW